MRDLSTNEIQTVSGAGLFSNFGRHLGGAIGAIVDSSTVSKTGKAPAVSSVSPAIELGESIGATVDNLLNPVGLGVSVVGILNGVNDIIHVANANSAASK